MVNAFLRIVQEAQPTYWLMENVPPLKKHVGNPKVETCLGVRRMRRCFWGEFPAFLIPKDGTKYVYHHDFYHSKTGKRKKDEGPIVAIQGKLRKWQRAKIPFPTAQALAQAIKTDLYNKRIEECYPKSEVHYTIIPYVSNVTATSAMKKGGI